MTSREQFLTEELRKAERDALSVEEFTTGIGAPLRVEAQPLIARARDRVIALELDLADQCPSC